MAKLSTVTRQLAERRARLAAEVPRLEKLASDIAEQLAKARAELAAVDLILPTFDARVVPELIAPVKAQGVRYGKRGTFKDALLGLLQATAPNAMSTVELSMRLRHHFDLDFATSEELKNWNDNILRKQLQRSAREGVIERSKVGDAHSDDAYWRMALEGAEGSLEELRAQAAPALAGGSVGVCVSPQRDSPVCYAGRCAASATHGCLLLWFSAFRFESVSNSPLMYCDLR